MKKIIISLFFAGSCFMINCSGSGADGTEFISDRIYFIEMASGTEAYGELKYLETDSDEVKSLGKKVYSFDISRDKSKIVIGEYLNGYTGSYLAVMDLDGKNYKQTNVKVNNPVFNSDDTLIYGDDSTDIFSIKADGTGKTVISFPEVTGNKRFPKFNNDGTLMAFIQWNNPLKSWLDQSNKIYLFNISAGTVTPVNTTALPVNFFNWSEDSSTIIFSVITGITPPVRDIYSVPAGGGLPVRITDNSSPAYGACGFPSFMGDKLLMTTTINKKFFYRSDWDGNHYKFEMAKMNNDGTGISILMENVPAKDPVYVSMD